MSTPDWRMPRHRAEDPQGTLRIRDFGDKVHLWFKQRVSWPVALEILKELKAPDPADDSMRLPTRDDPRMRASKDSRRSA